MSFGGLIGLAVDALVVGAVTCAVCGLAHQTSQHGRYTSMGSRHEPRSAPPAVKRRANNWPMMIDDDARDYGVRLLG